MPRKPRVFISSTMEDLFSERIAVVDRLRGYNFIEPVNAENLLPSGQASWELIKDEIADCDLFVLILGGRYGYIPPEEKASGKNRSVTHLEYDTARELASPIPILPFLMEQGRLPKPKTEDETKDAERRDAFRKEVGEWVAGRFYATFNNYKDLEKKVGEAVIQALLRPAREPREAVAQTDVKEQPVTDADKLRIPVKLTKQVADRRALLIAGAGISMPAGFPSARAMSEFLISEIPERRADYASISSDAHVLEVSDTFEAAFGREELLPLLQEIIRAPQGDRPTEAHMLAVRLFKKILTTNQDCLFEAACEAQGIPCLTVYDNRDVPEAAEGVTLIKIHGSINHPESLVITERDFWAMEQTRNKLWTAALELVKSSPLLIVGSSLQDMHMKQFLFARDRQSEGWIVTPRVSPYERLRYEGFNLHPIRTYADVFFRALTKQAANQNA